MSSFALLRTTPRGIYPLGMTKKVIPSQKLRALAQGLGSGQSFGALSLSE